MQLRDDFWLGRTLPTGQIISSLPNSKFFAHQTRNGAEILRIHQRFLGFFVFVLYFWLQGADAALSVTVGKQASLLTSFETHDGSNWRHPTILVHEL
jgi:hypothetical protein